MHVSVYGPFREVDAEGVERFVARVMCYIAVVGYVPEGEYVGWTPEEARAKAEKRQGVLLGTGA